MTIARFFQGMRAMPDDHGLVVTRLVPVMVGSSIFKTAADPSLRAARFIGCVHLRPSGGSLSEGATERVDGARAGEGAGCGAGPNRDRADQTNVGACASGRNQTDSYPTGSKRNSKVGCPGETW